MNALTGRKSARDRQRRIWHYVSGAPTASLREIAASCGIPLSLVAYHLRALEQLGYIEHDPMRARARRVVLPSMDGRVGRL